MHANACMPGMPACTYHLLITWLHTGTPGTHQPGGQLHSRLALWLDTSAGQVKVQQQIMGKRLPQNDAAQNAHKKTKHTAERKECRNAECESKNNKIYRNHVIILCYKI